MPIGAYTPPPLSNHYTKKIIYIFHFRCMLLQICHKKFFIRISILGRSGVKLSKYCDIDARLTNFRN